MSELRKRCSQRPLDDHHVTVCEVPDPTCIAVSSEDEIKSTDTVSLYFEAAKSGGNMYKNGYENVDLGKIT